MIFDFALTQLSVWRFTVFTMKPIYALTVRLLLLIGLLTGCTTLAQSEYGLELTLNGESVAFEVEAPATLENGVITAPEGENVTVTFKGGRLELNLTDWNTFDYAHVLGTTFTRTAENTYRVAATVRHNDQGWDNYADAFEVRGENVQNGLRELAHPHDNEQPFTRSQSGVEATGLVYVQAKDNVEGLGGSVIYLDLASFADDEIEVSYDLEATQ